PARSDAESHAASCARCGELIAGLRSVMQQARALPELAPSRDLWSDIEARIQAPVISLGATGKEGGRRFGSGWMAAAAALLVFASSGITYLVTKNAAGGEGSVDIAARAPAVVPETVVVVQPPTAPSANTQIATEAPKPRPQRPGSERAGRGLGSTEGGGIAPGATLAAGNGESGGAALSTYDREITGLRAVVESRSVDLDPATVAIVERNLLLIDAAIAQSRAALERDPGSRFLNQQLDQALAKKVDLLRTVALLPSRS
ncbi:MAG: hypothetical protein ACREON_00535, partial [Gemmatimonadaceae bacterium]